MPLFRRRDAADANDLATRLEQADDAMDEDDPRAALRIADGVLKDTEKASPEAVSAQVVRAEALRARERYRDADKAAAQPGLSPGSAILGDDFPERIPLYQRNHENVCATLGDLVEEIRRTILHEVGHHFGMDHDELPY